MTAENDPVRVDLHPSEQNRKKLQTVLLLAGSDMDQAAAAARALQTEMEYLLARALETAIAVCYMRPFTRSAMTLPDSFVPTTEPDAGYHAEFKTLRDKVCAHTDKASGRSASMNVETATDGVVRLAYRTPGIRSNGKPFPPPSPSLNGRPTCSVAKLLTSRCNSHRMGRDWARKARSKTFGASRNPCAGAEALFRTRTGDPLLTMEVLYQLS
jgi:hypothetical protein